MTQYTMQAQASDSKLLYYWGSSSRDYAGVGYPGTGTPQEVAVAAFQPADVSGVVDSFNGRTGVVSPQAGDYDAAQIQYSPLSSPLSSVTVQGAIDEVSTVLIKDEPSNYSILPADVGQVVVSSSSTDAGYTLTDSALFPIGGVVEVVQGGAGSLLLVEGAGTTIKRSRFAILTLGGEGSTVRLRKQSAGTWIASGGLKEQKPLLKYRLDGTPTADNTPFAVSNVVGQGGFAESATASDEFVMPVAGQYRITFNASVAWSETGNEHFMGISISRRNISNTGWTQIGSQQVYKPTSSGPTAEIPVNFSFIATLGAGQEVRILPSSAGTTTPDSAANDRNECSFEWISD